MTYQGLRDEFAVAALKLVGPGDSSIHIARRCYDIVDAMIAERRKRNAAVQSQQPDPQPPDGAQGETKLRHALDLAVGALKSTTIQHTETRCSPDGQVTASWKTTVWDGLGEEQKREIEEALKL